VLRALLVPKRLADSTDRLEAGSESEGEGREGHPRDGRETGTRANRAPGVARERTTGKRRGWHLKWIPVIDPLHGLDNDAVAERVRLGEVNEVPDVTSRTTGAIFRSNILTPFNALLGTLFVVILLTGAVQDALFGVVLIANTGIGIFQELKAKRTLEQLRVLAAPRARVVRSGAPRDVAVNEVVRDDVLELLPGDQVVVDGTILSSNGLELDESLVSGESEPLERGVAEVVLSGSFVAAGTGRYRATRVGRAAYAATLSEQARRFTLVRSELRDGINRILKYVTWAIVPTAALLFISQFRLYDSFSAGVSGAVAGTVGMVPEGLVLLTSVAFAVAVVRLGRRHVLVQELPAVEGLARVNVLCTDKTGTLTEGHLEVTDLEVLDSQLTKEELVAALTELAAADPAPNATMAAIRAAYPASQRRWEVAEAVPFSSARKWSGTSFTGQGTWVLGAPEVLLDENTHATEGSGIVQRVQARAERGKRVVLLGRSRAVLDGETPPANLEPLALVIQEDRVRADAPAILSYFGRQGVEVKVISGDDPATVAAIAAEAGLEPLGPPVDARSLPDEIASLGQELRTHRVFGRVTPHQKRSMVAALQADRNVVAMTGDGVNDVLALKDADIGVAMGSGSAASRSAAQLVLLDSSFAALPAAVAEGRRVIANIERTGNLFLSKTVYAMLLAIAVGVARVPFPFLPRHLTLISTLTIGIPGFFLALAPSDRAARSGFIGRILRFAVPAGFLAAAGTFAAYALARFLGTPLVVAQTTATVVLFAIGLVILAAIASPLSGPRGALVASMGGAFLVVLAVPALRDFFALTLPPLIVWLLAGVIAAAVSPVVWWLLRSAQRAQAPGEREAEVAREAPTLAGAGGWERVRRVRSWATVRAPGVVGWLRERLDRNTPRGLPLTFAVVAAGIAAWVFAGLTQDVLGHDDTVLYDPRVTSLVVAHRTAWLTPPAEVLTWLGSNAVVIPLAIVVGGFFLLRRRDWRPLALFAFGIAGAITLYDIVKPLVGRPRPPASVWIGHYSGASFPSGHSTQAVAFYALLAVVLSKEVTPGRRTLLWTGAALVILVVGATRVYLGAHWLTDVLGGYALGAMWAAIVIAITLLVNAYKPHGRASDAPRAGGRATPSNTREAA